jgi:hypothetical protein
MTTKVPPPEQTPKQKSAALALIIRPLRTAQYETDIFFSSLEQSLASYAKDWGGMELNPDYQRGHVWTSDQQRHYIENILRGVVSTSGFVIQMNCPNWDVDKYQGDLPRGFQCIDGLQRITAVLKFLAGEVHPFGLNVDELDGTSFSMRRSLFRFRFAIHNFESRADLLQHYLDLNVGGTPHTSEEITRVKGLLDDCASNDNFCKDSVRMIQTQRF